MALTLKKKQADMPNNNNSASNSVGKSVSLHTAKGDEIIAKLQRKVAENEANAKKHMTKGPDYDERLAKSFYMNTKLLKDEIAKIKMNQAQSDILVSKVEADDYTAQTAQFMSDITRAQKTAAKSIDIDKVNRTAQRMNDSRMELDQASKTVNDAMGDTVNNMLRTKLTNDDDADMNTQLAKNDTQMSGFDADFMLWSQAVSVETPVVNSNVPTFNPADRVVEEPAYLKALKQQARQEAALQK
jgi:hypothetical protein